MMVSRLYEFPSLLALLTEEAFQPLNTSSEGVMDQTLTCLIAFDDLLSLFRRPLRKLMERNLVFPLFHLLSSLGARQPNTRLVFKPNDRAAALLGQGAQTVDHPAAGGSPTA